MSIQICEILLPSAHFGGESTLPSVYGMSNVQALTQSRLDEDDELFVGYGFLPSLFPYRMQDLYDRADEPTAYLAVVLENDYLKAAFLPQLGGRLWSLYDKTAQKELLYENSIVRPCNLAVRNAWLAGGIEFNCGMVGHHPYTCSTIHAAQTALEDGTPVLRMYEYERIRGCVYQMDFFLPKDAKFLFGRMRIVNPTHRTTPMYWWTNMALRENPKARDIIDATETYNNAGGIVGKNAVPYRNGIDITYPSNNPVAIDYFWKIPKAARKYTAYLDENGDGFVQTSTARLKGRKLFVWGQGEGGKRWQEFLTEDQKDGRYIEIQAGLAHTQYECIPMPPNTAWEWLEAYGSLHADPQKVHGDWADARAEVGEVLQNMLPAEKLEQMLCDTKQMATTPAKEMICYGSGWGGLENLRRAQTGELPICPHLEFSKPGHEQEAWVRLLQTGSIAVGEKPDMTPPVSWMLQPEWTNALEQSADCHEKYLHLAAIYLASCRYVEAEIALQKALQSAKTATALFLKAQLLSLQGDKASCAKTALEAHGLLPKDLSLARGAFTFTLEAKEYAALIAAYEKAPESIRKDGRAAMLYANALVECGRWQDAKAVLEADGGLLVTDIREGEFSLTELYVRIAKAAAVAKGEAFDPNTLQIPRRFDFRMNVK